MCIMEVRPGQRDSTIAQALAHNTRTILSDIELFWPLLKSRSPQHLPLLDQFQAELSFASRSALQLWARLVEAVVAAEPDPAAHAHEHYGNERAYAGHAGQDSDQAARTAAIEESARELVVGYPPDPDDDEYQLERVARQDIARAAQYETRR